MSDLSLGLMFGLAAAGAVGGVVYNTYAQLSNLVGGGISQSRTALSPKKNVFAAAALGAVLGGAAGLGIGYGVEQVRAPHAPVTQNLVTLGGVKAIQPK